MARTRFRRIQPTQEDLKDPKSVQRFLSQMQDSARDEFENLHAKLDAVKEPSFSVARTSVQSMGAGAYTLVVPNSVEWDTDEAWDMTNSRYVVPKKGLWHFTAYGGLTALADQRQTFVSLYRNSAAARIGSSAYGSGSSNIGSLLSSYLECDKGDKIQLYQWNGDASSRNSFAGASQNSFQGLWKQEQA